MRLEEVLAPVSGELEVVEAQLRDWASGEPPVVFDAVGHVIRAGGKRLRPACLLLAAGLGRDGAVRRAHGALSRESKGAGRETRVEFAAAIELIHTASLVHDDIIDGSAVRRGVPTLHARWGQAVALLVGNLIYSRLFRRLSEDGHHEALGAVAYAVHRMVVGELAETLRRDDLDITEREYLEIIRDKTGALFSCAAYLGACAGGLQPEERAKLRRYGEHLGNAFQILDDVFDLCEDARRLGKPAGADLRDGKVTLPVIHALERERQRGDGKIRTLFREKRTGELREAVLESGSLHYAIRRAEELRCEAASCLDGLPAGPCLRGLVQMGEYVVGRGREALARAAARSGRDRCPDDAAARGPRRTVGIR